MKQTLVIIALLASVNAFSPVHRSGTVRHNIQVSAEWQPKDGTWKNQDFEAEIKKLEKDAEERMDAKIEELMSQIATTGSKSK